MCGITGVLGPYANLQNTKSLARESLENLQQRGPDNQNLKSGDGFILGHSRLSIIDLSDAGNQPVTCSNNRYHMVYNGEVYNYRELRQELKLLGYHFNSSSDTEVVFYSLCEWGKKALEKFNGFFSLAFIDAESKTSFLARDRFGIKPLYYIFKNNSLCFASELKSLLPYLEKEALLDKVSLAIYLQLTYIPAPFSILKNARKLMPGQLVEFSHGQIKLYNFYDLLSKKDNLNPAMSQYSYQEKCEHLSLKLSRSIEKRLVSDAPLGSFLSGGIDSGIVTGLAAKACPTLKSFSVGFDENRLHDETPYALSCAKKFQTNHEVIRVCQKDYHSSIDDILNYIDEPFADSSAIPFYLLSKKVKEHVSVALSGDGADELFAGYNKYKAEFYIRNSAFLRILSHIPLPWNILPKSRESKIGNISRQFQKFINASKLSPSQRYLELCRFNNEQSVFSLFTSEFLEDFDYREYTNRLSSLNSIQNPSSINDVLFNDMNLILPNDMLHKVDLMSMANSLEVRVPFLDHDIVEFSLGLAPKDKINSKMNKKILQDTFKDLLPPELYNRPKQGFSVPLMNWFSGDYYQKIHHNWLNIEQVKSQKIFNVEKIERIKQSIRSGKSNDLQALIWSLIVWQNSQSKIF